jgi:hypothetical protein
MEEGWNVTIQHLHGRIINCYEANFKQCGKVVFGTKKHYIDEYNFSTISFLFHY